MKLEIACTRVVPGFTVQVAATFSAPVTGVIGPSGAGKTTLLHLVTGLLRPTQGRVVLDGAVLAEVADHGRVTAMVPAHRRGIAAVFQDGRLFPHLDVRGNLLYGADARAMARGRERGLPDFAEVVEMLGIAALLARRTAQLSGGERQRVALGRALLCAPRLLVLDEPLAALDAALRRQILPFLRRIRDRGVPMLYVAHDPDEVLYLAGELALLKDGRLRGAGTVRALAQRPELAGDLHALGLHNVIGGTIVASDTAHCAFALGFGPVIQAPPGLGAVGDHRTIAIDPAGISLALAPVTGISIRNQIPGMVAAVIAGGERTVVAVDVGVELRVEVSRAAVAELGLAPGVAVHCLFKAQAVRAVD